MTSPAIRPRVPMAEGRERAVAALLRVATASDVEADALEEAGHPIECRRKRGNAVSARALAVQVGSARR